jgi:hypothetical protein
MCPGSRKQKWLARRGQLLARESSYLFQVRLVFGFASPTLFLTLWPSTVSPTLTNFSLSKTEIISQHFFERGITSWHCLCGLVVKTSRLQIQRSGFDSRRYQIFLRSSGPGRGPLRLVRINEELFQGNCGSGLENRNSRLWGIRCADHATPSTRLSWH